MPRLLQRIWPTALEPWLQVPGAYPMDFDAYPRVCPNCGGAGVMWVYIVDKGPFRSSSAKGKYLELPDGKSGWYSGELKVDNCPVCRGGKLQEFLSRMCGLTGKDLIVSLEEYEIHGPFEGKAQAKETAGHLLGMNKDAHGLATFWGGYGVGKTHILKAIVNGFRKIGITARYSNLGDQLADIRRRYGNEDGSISMEDMIDEVRTIRVLALDEINQVNLTGWAKETINRLLDYRYNYRDELLTVLALNANPDQLPAEFGYLASRIREGIVCEVGGADVREALAPQALWK